jgi:hypothetical protein
LSLNIDNFLDVSQPTGQKKYVLNAKIPGIPGILLADTYFFFSKKISVNSSAKCQYLFSNPLRGLALREMPESFQHHALVGAVEPTLFARRSLHRVDAILGTVEH